MTHPRYVSDQPAPNRAIPLHETECSPLPDDQVEAGGRIQAATEVLVNALFSPFRDLDRSPTPAELNLFVDDLFENAAAIVEAFCLRYAFAIRSETVVHAVRAEPAAVLAHEIRTTIFHQIDRYIDSYRRSEAEVGAQLAKLDDDLEDSSVAASAVVGAAVGQAAGGFGNRAEFSAPSPELLRLRGLGLVKIAC